MEIQFHGGNCISVGVKKARVVVDDNLASLGLKSITKEEDIAIFTSSDQNSSSKASFKIVQPGEYEVSNVSIQGIPARSHMDESTQKTATIYKIIADDIRLSVVGHIHPNLTEEQLEAIGTVDILVVPVGGNGYTLDGIGALKVIKEIGPKIIIPTHYQEKDINYPVPQNSLQDVLKDLAMEPFQKTDKLKIKVADLVDATRLIVIEQS